MDFHIDNCIEVRYLALLTFALHEWEEGGQWFILLPWNFGFVSSDDVVMWNESSYCSVGITRKILQIMGHLS